VVRGALAGAAAAALWAAAEPGVARVVGVPPGYSDVRLLGGLLTCGAGRWRAAGIAAHLVNGAAFGAAFERTGARGWRQGLAAAQAENLVLWPVMALVDRMHPDRRTGRWPRLLGNRRVFAYEAAVHALFGAVLGALCAPPRVSGRSRRPERPRSPSA
jgi:hypothetical protein